MKSENAFGVYPRKMKSGKVIYYYWAYSSEGKRVYRSTKAETYEKGVRFCRDLLKTGRLASEKSYIFAKYTEHFFVFDACPYIKTRLLHGKSYTRGWAQTQRSLLTGRIIPEFGEMDIRDIYESRIEGWLFRLKQENTGNKTLNHLITVLRLIFAYALKAHDIDANPMEYIEPFSLKTAEKGIFTQAEMAMLFADGVWESVTHYTLNLTAAMTGMRLGELLALRFENVQPSVITVAYSWSRTDKLKCPKNGKVRQIPIPGGLYRLLHNLNRDGTQSDFIFAYHSQPMDHKSVYKRFYAALETVGLDERERKARNITFHSYRHWFNTRLLESGLAPETVRLLTGHSAGMTARYSHIQLTGMKNQPMIDLPVFNPFQNAVPLSITG